MSPLVTSSLEGSPIASWLCEPVTLAVIDANDAAVAALGWPRAALIGTSLRALWIDVAHGEAALAEALAHRRLVTWRQRTAVGAELEVEAAVTRAAADDALLVQVVRTGDAAMSPHVSPAVEKIVAARKALDEANRRLESMLSATSAMIYSCVAEPPFGATFISDNVSAVLGYTPAEFTIAGDFWATHIHPDDRDAILAEVPRVFARGRHVHEYRFRHADGSYRWMHDDLVLIRDAHGAPVELVGCFFDVTARREAEASVRRSEASFRALIERLPLAVIVHRADRILYANPAMVALLGYHGPEDLIGRSPTAIVSPSFRDLARRGASHLAASPLNTRKPVAEGAMLRADGSVVEIEVEAVNLAFDGEPAIVVLARDLTDRRAAVARMAAADRLAAVGTLAAGVAHEINNPLAYVQTNLSMLAEELPAILRGGDRVRLRAADIEALVRDARDGASRIRSLVRDLQTLSHPDRDSISTIDVREVVATCLRMADNEIRHRATLISALEEVPPVDGNPSRLGQVFLNLLINAAQAIPEAADGGGRHQIRVSTRRAPSGGVIAEVADTGVGIPDELLGRIFNPFFTTKPVGSGTGLGLAICHGIVKGMGGDITVESRRGHGATFRVTLPASHGHAHGHAHAPAPAPPPAAAIARMRVLVIDDEPAITRSLELLLGVDHDVVAVTRAADALARLDAGAGFDAILCDLMMPEMSGMRFHELLLARAPALAARVVFLTGGAFTPASQDFLDRVPNPRLDKPFTIDALLAALRAVGAR